MPHVPGTTPLWNIDELGAQVALALSVNYDGPADGRSRDVPDRRTIRYYTTIGLIDRAQEMRGRTALYGRRHLLQLVAIKRLQGRGLALSAIQQRLVGLDNAALARIAKLPDLSGLTRDERPSERAESFWKEVPASVAAPPERNPVDESPVSRPWRGVPLGENALLMLAATRDLDEDDLAALRVAAAPLVKLLHSRRLVGPRPERGSS